MKWMRLALMLAFLADPAVAARRGPLPPAPARADTNRVSDFVGYRADRDPALTVIALFQAFVQRDVEGYLSTMSADYTFDSDDPAFRAAYSHRYGRDDERAFMTHLFRGGGRAPDGRALPTAVSASDAQGPLWVDARRIDATHAVAHVRRFGPVLVMSDSSRLVLGGSDNVLELRLEDGLWRVFTWHESVRRAAGEPDGGATAAAADSTAAIARLSAPARLGLRLLAEPGRGTMSFALATPGPGGVLELFDLQGRRLARRDLGDLAAGEHRVALPAASLAAGVYWARASRAGLVATARVIWLR